MTYVNPALVDPQSFASVRLGFRVDRPTATVPQDAAAGALFTIAGGRVALLALVGEVTTTMHAQANAIKLVANPTTGTSVDICATVESNGDEVGTLYGITGTFGDAMVGANAGATVLPARPVVLPVGTLDLNCADGGTGSVKWTAWYVPLDEGATMVAA